MNRRLFLNVIIVSILTFYLIFSIVYRQLMEEKTPDLTDASPWQQPYLIPKGWSLTFLEFPKVRFERNQKDEWQQAGELITARQRLIPNNWMGLVIQDISNYDHPVQGMVVIAQVEEQQQPIVFRIIRDETEIQFYRMNDKRLFRLPIELADVLLID